MIEQIWNAFPLFINPREALRQTWPRRGRKGGIRRAEEAKRGREALRILLAALLLLGTLLPHRW